MSDREWNIDEHFEMLSIGMPSWTSRKYPIHLYVYNAGESVAMSIEQAEKLRAALDEAIATAKLSISG
jgi:hypothetical protein